MAASDLELALRSYDQLFRRLLKFKHNSVSEDRSKELLTITVLLDESGVDTDADCGVEHYAGQIEAFLRQLWTEQYDKVPYYLSATRCMHCRINCCFYALYVVRNRRTSPRP